MRLEKSLLLFLGCFLVLAVAWGVYIPPYENLDEIEHSEVVRYLVTMGQLPVHGEAEAAGYAVRQEASQPPLYYFLAAGWAKLWGLPPDPPTVQLIPGGMVSCGPADTFYNRATWARSPYTEGWPWQGNLLWLHGLRLFSSLLQLITVAGVWTLARRFFPRGPFPAFVTAIVVFNPQFLLVASGVNNDNLVTPLAVWGLVLMMVILQEGLSARRVMGLGILAGLAGLSKLSGIALVGMGGLVILWRLWQDRVPFPRWILAGLQLVIPAVGLLLPWVWRNWQLYGDLTALTPMLALVGRRDFAVDWIGEARLMFLSYWGQFPCTFYPQAFYWFYTALVIGGVIGLAAGWKYFTRQQRWGGLLAALWFVVIVTAWCRWTLITPASGGRLLFPAAPAVAILIAGGWWGLGQRFRFGSWWVRWGATWVIIAGWAGFLAGPLFLFAPPRLLDDSAAVPNPIELTFGDEIRVKGYTAEIVETPWACRLWGAAYCGRSLATTIFWEALRPLENNRVLILQLRSARSGDTTLRMGYNRWPGGGNLPTSAAPVGRIIADRYLFPLSDSDMPTQAWDFQVGWTDESLSQRLTVYKDGTEIGSAAGLTTLRVPGVGVTCANEDILADPVQLGEGIRLTHVRVAPAEDGNWLISLCWESLAAVPADYTVFVHADDAEGQPIGTGDGPPMGNAFPSHLWHPGDRILDLHTIALPGGSQPARIVVGLYDPVSGIRLTAVQKGIRLVDDMIVIWQQP